MRLSIRDEIIISIKDHLSIIRLENGFNTDIGQRVIAGQARPEPNCIFIFDHTEEPNPFYGDLSLAFLLTIVAYVPVPADSVDFSEAQRSLTGAMLADIKLAFGQFADINFSGANGEIISGQDITGQASDANGIVWNVELESGYWDGTGNGIIKSAGINGPFRKGEIIEHINGTMTVDSISYQSIADIIGAVNVNYKAGGLDSQPDIQDRVAAIGVTYEIAYMQSKFNPYLKG